MDELLTGERDIGSNSPIIAMLISNLSFKGTKF